VNHEPSFGFLHINNACHNKSKQSYLELNTSLKSTWFIYSIMLCNLRRT